MAMNGDFIAEKMSDDAEFLAALETTNWGKCEEVRSWGWVRLAARGCGSSLKNCRYGMFSCIPGLILSGSGS
jgi:hypothetical protein